MKVVDFRSDTVTKPSPEMWEIVKSMDDSKLGDDVEVEDPTVNELEQKAAKLVGKDASFYVTSGTQGKLLLWISQKKPPWRKLWLNFIKMELKYLALIIREIRFVTHCGINEDDIQYSIETINKVLQKCL